MSVILPTVPIGTPCTLSMRLSWSTRLSQSCHLVRFHPITRLSNYKSAWRIRSRREGVQTINLEPSCNGNLPYSVTHPTHYRPITYGAKMTQHKCGKPLECHSCRETLNLPTARRLVTRPSASSVWWPTSHSAPYLHACN